MKDINGIEVKIRKFDEKVELYLQRLFRVCPKIFSEVCAYRYLKPIDIVTCNGCKSLY